MPFIGNQPADKFLTLEKQVFTTSATDTYSLDREVSSVNDIELFLNNVRQEPTEAYTISGTTLTLASAITSSDSMYCIYQGRAVGTQSPAVGSVTNDMLAGSIANSKLANSSITVNGTSISLGASGNISAGITEADQWRLTANKTSTGDITANLERVDTGGFGYIGTGMTESSGIFTFPSTGIYSVTFNMFADDYVRVSTLTTTDNSTFVTAALTKGDISGGEAASCIFLFDVTDTSTHKVKFKFYEGTGTLQGSTSDNQTHFTFIRLGDT